VKGLHVAAVHVASLLGCEDTGVLDEEMIVLVRRFQQLSTIFVLFLPPLPVEEMIQFDKYSSNTHLLLLMEEILHQLIW